MSFAGPRHLLNPEVKDYSTIFSIKKISVSQVKKENILQKLVFMATFEEISKWVEIYSNGKRFIANPLNAGDADRLDCLFAIQEPLALALKKIEIRRKNGRDRRLLKALESRNYAVIAAVLASTAATYWRNHGFFTKNKKSREKRAIASQLQNQEKKELNKAQIEKIGAVLCFTKARKKGALQEVLDFEETEEILKIFDDMVE